MEKVIVRKNPATGLWEHKVGDNWVQGVYGNDNVINIVNYKNYIEKDKIYFYKELDLPLIKLEANKKSNIKNISKENIEFKYFKREIVSEEIALTENQINWDVEDNI